MKKLFLCGLAALAATTASAQYSHTVMAENLGRGAVAVKNGTKVFISWRSLISDNKDLAFNVYRDGVKLNDTPISNRTNFEDNSGTETSKYEVKAVLNGVETSETSGEVSVWANPYMTVHLDRPEGGTSPAGGKNEQREYTYTPDDVSVGDVDGDGQYELFVKWFPTNQADNSHRRYTGKTLIDCYRLDGTKLWRIDLGQNIRSGNHYTQFMVYDFDGDGKAELICKTAPGTIDGQGKAVLMGSDKVDDDYRTKSGDNAGIVVSGPEYLTVFNGLTGAEINTIAYNPPRTIQSTGSWGDSYGNRSERYLAGVAYLDGQKPSAVFCRGYYTHSYLWAVDFDGKQLKERWLHASTTKGQGAYGEGAHSLTVGDVDGDGCDEIVYGSACIDHDGKLLYRTGAGHGDALHLGHFDPDREGLQVFMVHEEKSSSYKWDSEFRDARTGEIIWGTPQTGHDIGRGLTANISSKFRGYEVWPGSYYASNDDASRNNTTFTCTGDVAISGKVPSSNFRIYWDGDLLDELFDGKYNSSNNTSAPVITKRNEALTSDSKSWTFHRYSNASSCNTTKATPNLQADIMGDWREELILHDGVTESDLLIFTTTIPSDYKVPCLMQDRQYRLAIAWQNVAYNQPPHLSYNLEEKFNTKPAFTLNSGSMNQVVYVGDEIEPIEFTVKRATGVNAEGLPEGVSLEFDDASLQGKISGRITKAGEYAFTLTTTGGEENATLSGSLVARVNTSVQLVAQYPFEVVGETVTNTVNPEGAIAHDAKAGNAVEGKVGKALALDGTNCYVQKPYDLIDFGNNAFSVEFWMNSKAEAAYILHKGSITADAATGATGNWMGLEIKNGEFRFAVDDNVTKTQLGWKEASKVLNGQWHHIVAVRDVVAKQLLLYIDGELIGTQADGTGAINCPTEDFVIGNVNVAFNNPFNGMLDELSIYRGAMSPAKVKEHFEAEATEYLAKLPMDEVGETTPNEVLGAATVNGSTTLAEGVKSGAISLDGTSFLTQPMYDKINMGERDFTAEMWIKTTDADGYAFCIGSHNHTNVEGGTGNWIGLEIKNGTHFTIDDDKTKTDCIGADINDGKWHHVACVRDYAAKTMRLYIDGQESASVENVATLGINCSATELLYIGADDEANRGLEGTIDEFVIYPAALTPEKIAENYELYRLSEVNEIIAGGSERARCTIVNPFSGVIVRTAIGAASEELIDTLAPGIYILVIEDAGQTQTYKFVKR